MIKHQTNEFCNKTTEDVIKPLLKYDFYFKSLTIKLFYFKDS